MTGKSGHHRPNTHHADHDHRQQPQLAPAGSPGADPRRSARPGPLRDGLKLCWSEHLTLDLADQLSAICSGIQALAQGASMEFGDGTGGVRQSMTEFHGGLLFIVEAGAGAHLAVVAGEDADPGVVGHQMMELVEQIGDHLRAEPRTEAAGSGTS